MDGMFDPLLDQENESSIDDIMESLQESIEALKPKYPGWLYVTDKKTGERVVKPPKAPTSATFEDWISTDALRFNELQLRFLEDIRLYRQMETERFAGFDPDIDSRFVSSEPTTQINKVASMISGTPWNISYPWRTKAERSDAESLEEWANWFMRSWELHHRQSGSSELMWDIAWSGLMFGRQVIKVTCDLEDPDFPWSLDVLDPSTCYPTWGKGKHGLIRMSREYIDTLAAVLDDFDPADRKGIRKKLAAHNSLDPNDIDDDREVTVKECWTRWHHFASVDGVVVKEPTAHEYGVVPFIYNLAPGEMSAAAAPRSGFGLTAQEIAAGYGTGLNRSRQFDLAEKGVSFLHPIRNAIQQREIIASMHLTAMQQTLNPATITTNPYPTPAEPLDLGPGGSNERKPGQQTMPAIPSPKPIDSQPLFGMLNGEIAKAALPDVIFGQVEGSNVTGFASDTLMAAAKDRIQPYINLTEKTIEDTLVLAAYLFRNFGHLCDGLSDGALLVPRERRGGMGDMPGKAAPMPSWAGPIMAKLLQQAIMPQQPPAPQPQRPLTGAEGGVPAMPPMGQPMMGGMPPMGQPPMGQPPMGGMPPMAPPAPPQPPFPTDGNPTLLMTMSGVPMQDAPDVFISREVLDRLTGRPKVKLFNLGLQNRTMMANYLAMLVKEKLISRALAMENIPEITNAVSEWERIMAEDAQTNPAMMEKIYHPRMLWQQGDVEGFWTYWATVLIPQMAQSLGGAGSAPAPPGGAPPPGGPPPGMMAPAGPQTVRGDSNAMLGQGPGAMGAPVGRPG